MSQKREDKLDIMSKEKKKNTIEVQFLSSKLLPASIRILRI